MKDGHECVVYDVNTRAVDQLESEGAAGALVARGLRGASSRAAARGVGHGAGRVRRRDVDEVAAQLEPDDIVIDGGNSYYRDDIDRAEALAERGIHYVDVGTSGGVFGLERGFCLMIGGEDEVVAAPRSDLRHVRARRRCRAAHPGPHAASRDPAEHGYLHCGPIGAGHFVKMVHNGIEYGLMAAYAEGLNISRNADAGQAPARRRRRDHAAARPRVLPLRPRHRRVTEVWRRGSVVASWLLDLTARALSRVDPDLDGFAGRVSDSGEGRWTLMAAIDEGVPAHVLSAALFARFSSRGEADFADKVLSAMRKQFGGHDEKAG